MIKKILQCLLMLILLIAIEYKILVILNVSDVYEENIIIMVIVTIIFLTMIICTYSIAKCLTYFLNDKNSIDNDININYI